MKKIIAVLLFIFSFLPFLNGEVQAQASNTDVDVIIVRVYEESLKASSIVISYGDGKTETMEMESTGRKYRGPNAEKINSIFQKILGMGYELISSAGTGENDTILTYIFQKKKK
jgi:hypothetical protein